MIRHVDKHYLKPMPQISGLAMGKTIPICVSRDGREMTLNPATLHGTYQGWDLEIRRDDNGCYIELPLTEEEITTLLGRLVQ